MDSILVVDGSVLEGGGQILRNSVALSAILKKPIRIINIRAGRPKPGLRPQHLAGIKLAADLCDARLKGAEIGSTEITFEPGQIRGGNFLADTRTAGSIVLLLQVSLPIVAFCPEDVTITYRGGTDAAMAPQIDYFTQVFLPTVEKMGIGINVELKRRGFFPKGGGEVILSSGPDYRSLPIEAIQLNKFSNITTISGNAFITKGLRMENAHFMADAAEELLSKRCPTARSMISRVKLTESEAIGAGSGIVLWAETESGALLGGSALYDRDLTSAQMGTNAAKEIIQSIDSQASVDQYLQDQLILFMAIASGRSSILAGQVTLHTQTAIHIMETVAGVQFIVRSCSDNSNLIECDGLALQCQMSNS